MTVPPPTPNRPLKKPPTVPITSSFTKRSRVTGGDTNADEAGDSQRRVTDAPGVTARIDELLAPLRADPEESAILCDIDGTLAPIVSDPEDAAPGPPRRPPPPARPGRGGGGGARGAGARPRGAAPPLRARRVHNGPQ